MGESFWWAIATATTVGYGDVSPHTTIGKFTVVLLMFVGIGFIGMLTSSLTAFFTHEEDSNKKVLEKLEQIEKENTKLKEVINKLKH